MYIKIGATVIILSVDILPPLGAAFLLFFSMYKHKEQGEVIKKNFK